MSNLLERLESVTGEVSAPLGFGVSRPLNRPPALALLASVSDAARTDMAALRETGVDAVVLVRGLRATPSLKRLSSSLDGLCWGVSLPAMDTESRQAHEAAGCDFMAFGLEGAQAEALGEGALARILRVPSDLPEPTLRSLEDLPVDILLLQKPSGEGPLSLAHLVAIAAVRSMIGKYLLLEWEASLSTLELERLRDLGVDGLVVPAPLKDPQTITELRERLQALGVRKPRREARPTPVLPRVTGPTRRPQREEEDDDDDDGDEP